MKRFGPPKGRRRRKPDDPNWDAFFSEEEKQQQQSEQALELSLADAGLSVRIVNNLEERGVFTVAELAQKTREELLEIDNFGEKTLVECRDLMRKLNVSHPNWNRPPRRKGRAKSSRNKK